MAFEGEKAYTKKIGNTRNNRPLSTEGTSKSKDTSSKQGQGQGQGGPKKYKPAVKKSMRGFIQMCQDLVNQKKYD